MSQIREPRAPGRLLLAANVVLVAFNARPAFSSIGPVLPEAMRATGLSPGSAGLLTTLPVLCLGVFGLATAPFARRVGVERAVLFGLVALVAGLGIRIFGSAGLLVLGGVLGGVGIGVTNVLLPGIVKREFPDRTALMMGVYTMALCTGAAAAAGLTVPLSQALGGWPAGLAVWAIPAAVAALVWLVQVGGARHAPSAATAPGGGLWRDTIAWQTTLFMGLQSSLFYCVLAWLPPMLRARGLSPVEAGLVASISILVQAPAALVAPALAVRGRDQRLAVAIVVGLAIAGLAGLMFAPIPARWLWSVVLGLGQGAGFAVALTIIVLRSGDAQTAAELSGMSQGIGYSLAAVGPLFMGLLRDWTGGWTWPTVLFFAIALACLSAGLGAGRPLLVRPRPDPRSAPAAA